MVQKIITFNVALKSTERQWVQKIPEVYTNDLGSVSIQFNITDCTDTELTGSSAIVLLKMRDGSFFQGPSADVERTLNVFSYTLKENEGNHDGLAEIQLIVTISGKEFATQKYQFKVNSGLDSEVAREIMIYDWTSLTAEARAYIAQFTADEMVRDAEFDNAQFDRNVDFEVANTARNEAFALAQTQRNTDFGTDQAARVLAFNNAETARVNAFNLAEAARAEGYAADHARAESDHTMATSDATLAATARTNAATDRTNAATDRNLAAADHTRAESDHTRADADSATVGAFNTRLTAEETATASNKISAVKGKTFADVDARIEDIEIDTTLMATNLITNGDFLNGTTGWATYNSALEVVTNEYSSPSQSLKVTTTGQSGHAFKQIPTITPQNNYYISVKSKNGNTSGMTLAAYETSGGVNVQFIMNLSNFSNGVWTKTSKVFTANVSTLNIKMYPNTPSSIGDYRFFDDVILIDLTATFGKGNEPTVEQMDEIMAKFENSWFDGTKNLFQAKASLNKLMALDARTEFEAKNLVVNGGFVEGTTGWRLGNAEYVTLDTAIFGASPNSIKITTVATSGYVYRDIPSKGGNIIYAAMSYRLSSYTSGVIYLRAARINAFTMLSDKYGATTPLNTWLRTSLITTLPADSHGLRLLLGSAGDSSYTINIDDVVVIDLTATFGAGKEPTLAEMDRLMARFPNSWFDGAKPIQTIETLYQEKANKVQEAWITPTLINGATFDSGDPFRYRKNELGLVECKGKLNVLDGNAVLTFPVGYRTGSTAMRRYPVVKETIAVVHAIVQSGTLYATAGLIDFAALNFNAEG